MITKFYIELTPVFAGNGTVERVKATKVTQEYPGVLSNARSVVAEMDIDVDERVFAPMALRFAAVLPAGDSAHQKLLTAGH